MMDDRELALGIQGQLGDELHAARHLVGIVPAEKLANDEQQPRAAAPWDIGGFEDFQTGVDQLHQKMSKP